MRVTAVTSGLTVLRTYRLPKSKLVNISCKHGAGWEDGGVCGWHHSGRHRPQTKERDERRTEMLQDNGQDHVRLVLLHRRNRTVRRLIPISTHTHHILCISIIRNVLKYYTFYIRYEMQVSSSVIENKHSWNSVPDLAVKYVITDLWCVLYISLIH